MARLLTENFEGVGLSGWSAVTDTNCTVGGDWDIPGIAPIGAGSQCFRATVENSTNNQAYIYKAAASGQSVNYVRGYIYVDKHSEVSTEQFDTLLLLDSSAAFCTGVRVRNDGGQYTLRLRYYSDGVVNFTSAVNIDIKTWYRVEYKYNNIKAAPQWEFRVYDSDESYLGGSNGALTTTYRTPYYFLAGIYNSTATNSCVLYSDLLAWSNSAWVGDERENVRRSSFTTLPYTVYPVPDSVITKQDRAQASYLYSGLLRDVGFYTYYPNVGLDAHLCILSQIRTLSLDAVLSAFKNVSTNIGARLRSLRAENIKRSAFSILPYVIMPVADGTIGSFDRTQAAYLYSGIAIQTLIEGIIVNIDSVLKDVDRQREAYIDSILKLTKEQIVDVDAYIRRIITKLVDIDTVLKLIKSSSIDIDALIAVAGRLQVDINTILQQKTDVIVFRRPYDGRLMVLPVPPYINLSAVLSYFTFDKTIEIDSVLRGIKLKDLDIDAILAAGAITHTAAVDLNAYLEHEVDVVVFRRPYDGRLFVLPVPPYINLSVILEEAEQFRVVELDSVLQLSKDVNIDINAFLRFVKTANIDLDSILFATQTRQTDIDSILKTTSTITEILNAILTISRTRTLDLDAILQLIFAVQNDVYIDSILRLTKSKDIDLDVVIRMIEISNQIDLNTFLRALKSVSLDSDSILRLAKAKTIDLDGFFGILRTKTTELDTILKLIVATRTVNLDSAIKKVRTRTTDLGGLLKLLKENNVPIDSILKLTDKLKTTDLDAILSRIHVYGRDIDIDSVLRLVKTKTVSLDVLLILSLLSTVELDAILSVVKTKGVDLDSILKLTKLDTADLDAVLNIIRTPLSYLDAILKLAKTADVGLDAYLKGAITYLRTLNLDAIISEVARYGREVSLDTILKALNIRTADLDAVVRAAEIPLPIELTALLGVVRSATINLDSVLRILQSQYTSLDTILQATNLQIVNLDTLLRLAKTFNLDLDGIVTDVGVKLALVSTDAMLRKLRYQMQTMVAHSVRTFVSKGF